MPELPEVEMARRLAERVARHRTITAIRAVADPLVFERASASRLR